MFKSAIFVIVWIVISILCACATPKGDLALETDLQNTQKLLEQKNKKIEALEKTNLNLASEVKRIETIEKINQSLASEVDRLELEVEKRDAVIQIQGKAIKLFDDPKKTIENSLNDQIEEKLLEIQKSKGMKRLIYSNRDIFSPGGLKLSEKGKEILLELARSIKANKNQYIIVEGHTDNRPVAASSRQKYPTNWEISAKRATVVVRFLQEEGGLGPERLSAIGYSFYRPIASNDTEEGRRKNRRVEIILGPPI
jgi:chemotaxis protein MotB